MCGGGDGARYRNCIGRVPGTKSTHLQSVCKLEVEVNKTITLCNLVQTRLLAQRCGPVARELAAEAHGAIVRRGVAVDNRHAPVALLLDAEVVTTHLDAEPAIFAPVRAPRVAANPVVHAIISAPAVHRDLMVDHGEQLLLRVHAARVRVEALGRVHTGTDGTARVDLRLDLVGAGYTAVVAHFVHQRVRHLGAMPRGERI